MYLFNNILFGIRIQVNAAVRKGNLKQFTTALPTAHTVNIAHQLKSYALYCIVFILKLQNTNSLIMYHFLLF